MMSSLLLPALLLLPAAPLPAQADDPAICVEQKASEVLSAVANLSNGRLRKLHLVRPDLIPYPLAYELYC